MNVKLAKMLTLTLTAAILLSFAAAFPAYAVYDDGQVIMVNPLSGDANFTFDTSTMSYGSTFKVRVMVEPNGTLDLYGWQLKISFPTALLDCMGDALPAGHVFEGQGFNHPAPSIDDGAGTILTSAMMTTGYVDIDTEKPLTEITFKITATPSIVDPVISGDFGFLNVNISGGTYLLDSIGGKFDIEYVGGHYEYSWLAPTQTPYLEVRDAVDGDHEVVADAVGQVKDIDIYVHNCSAGWEMISVQFELWYNTTLLSYLGTAVAPTFVNGTFMESFVGVGEYGIVYIVKADFEGAPGPKGAPLGQNYFLVGIMKMPTMMGEWVPPFPTGEGKLITLKVQTLIQGLFPEIYTCALELKNVVFYNKYGDIVVPGVSTDGTYKMLPKVLGRMVDVYTQYPKPYGGQGLYQNSDMYWPQKEVILYALVTYNDWPEQSKDVAFQVIDPHGVTWAILYARTNDVGIATTSFRLPWPCDDPEYWFGEWTVVATVDIACEIKNDTLHFKYDFLVHIVKVTTDKDQYKHCEYMEITVDFKSYAIQTYNMTIAITALDETGVPFGYIYVQTQIGGAIYCHYKDYQVVESIHVIKWARAGVASIIVGALNDFPFNGGTVQSGPIDPTTVQILAEWAI